MKKAITTEKKKSKQREKIDVYQQVTNSILELLEQDIIPWRQPWSPYGMPKNGVSNQYYRGVNAVYLNTMIYTRQYEKPIFVTYNQAVDAGTFVKKGESGYKIIYFSKKITVDPKGKIDEYIFGRSSTVFNIAQLDNPEAIKCTVDVIPENKKLENCEAVYANMMNPPKLVHGNIERAYYKPSIDKINLPKIKFFDSTEEYYQTLFHELTHSTGHKSRLNRNLTGHFGSEDYAREELIAEMGASFLAANCGIFTIQKDNSASYIHDWKQMFSCNKRLFLQLCSAAQKSTDYILNKKA